MCFVSVCVILCNRKKKDYADPGDRGSSDRRRGHVGWVVVKAWFSGSGIWPVVEMRRRDGGWCRGGVGGVARRGVGG